MGKELSYGHDQEQRIQKSILSEAFSEVDEIVVRSLVAGTPDIALGFAESLLVTGQLRGIQLMKLFYELNRQWDKFRTDDDIEDYVFARLGVSARKFIEYRQIYEHILLPHPEMVGKPIIGLSGILVAAREGEFDEEDWKELARAPDSTTMFDIRRRVRGIQTSGSNRLVITWDRDGQLYCRRGDDAKRHIGYLSRDETDPDVAAAVARMVDAAGVVRL